MHLSWIVKFVFVVVDVLWLVFVVVVFYCKNNNALNTTYPMVWKVFSSNRLVFEMAQCYFRARLNERPLQIADRHLRLPSIQPSFTPAPLHPALLHLCALPSFNYLVSNIKPPPRAITIWSSLQEEVYSAVSEGLKFKTNCGIKSLRSEIFHLEAAQVYLPGLTEENVRGAIPTFWDALNWRAVTYRWISLELQHTLPTAQTSYS